MRRTGSSCLLRPRNSLSTEDLQRLAQDPPTATVLTSARLPTYCSDRDYILSELQVHAHSIRFLCDMQNNREGENRVDCLPSSLILYMLWKPNTYPTPRSFADGPLSESVRQCLLMNRDSAPEEELEHVRANPRSSPYSPRRQTISPLIQEKLKQNCSLEYDDEDGDVEEVMDSTYIDAEKQEEDRSESPREENQREDLSSDDDEKGASSTTPPSSPNPPPLKHDSDREQLTKIYVVIDRLSNYDTKESFPGLGELPNLPDLNCSSYDERQIHHVDRIDSHLSAQSDTDLLIIPTRNEDAIENQQHQQQREQNKENADRENQTDEQNKLNHLDHHNQEIQTAESLARAVASSRFLRNRIDGITVGITSDERAAPGLEACLKAVERGAKERRQVAKGVSWNLKSSYGRKKGDQLHQDERMMMDLQNGPVLVTSSSWDEGLNESDGQISIGDDRMQEFFRKQNFLQSLRDRSPKCSPLAIITCQPDDLEGINHDHHRQKHSHHHHSTYAGSSQKILQSRICAEWNGKGDFKTFSDRAMKDWRTVWCPSGVGDYSTNGSSNTNSGGSGWENIGRKKPRVPRISINGTDDEGFDENDSDEPISTLMVIAFLGFVVAYVWNHYGDHILGVSFENWLT
mmetsp:Transcript_18329/g.35658  ORF Transcript_18329/g.35658 Transcript_18329/m.35658 type:complete len:632 (-) Transcript_18329:116-2011(-)